MSLSIDDQKLLLVIINEYSQDNFPKLSKNYFLLEKKQIVVLAKDLWNKHTFSIKKKYLYKLFFK